MSSLMTVPVLCVIVAVCSFATEPVDKWVQQIESGNMLVETGDLAHAEDLYRAALLEAESMGDDLRVAVVLQNLGRLLDRRGLPREAEEVYVRSIHALNRSPVKDNALLVRASLGLSALYIQTGQDSKAEALIRSLLPGDPAGAKPDRASLMGSLGVILAHKGQLGEAEQVLRKTAEVCQGTLDPELHEVGAIAIANMAGIQMRRGRTAEAIASYRQALTIMESLPDPYPVTLAVTLGDYAGALRGMGDRDTAESLYRKAIGVAESRLGPNHAVLGRLLEECAEVLRDGGKQSEARGLADAAQRIRNESERDNQTEYTVSVEALGLKQ